MTKSTSTVRERLTGKPLIGFDTKVVSAPRAKVGGGGSETKAVRAPRAKVGSTGPEIKPGA